MNTSFFPLKNVNELKVQVRFTMRFFWLGSKRSVICSLYICNEKWKKRNIRIMLRDLLFARCSIYSLNLEKRTAALVTELPISVFHLLLQTKQKKIKFLTCYLFHKAKRSEKQTTPSITSLIRAKSISKTRGVKPLWSPLKCSSNNPLAGPHMVYVFPLPVCSIHKLKKKNHNHQLQQPKPKETH